MQEQPQTSPPRIAVVIHPVVQVVASLVILLFVGYTVATSWKDAQNIAHAVWVIIFVLLGVWFLHSLLKMFKQHHDAVHDLVIKKHQRATAGITVLKQQEKLKQEIAKTEAFQQVPSLIKYAIDAGHNVSYGGATITNYLSNVHTLAGDKATQLLTQPPIYVPPPHEFSSILNSGYVPSPDSIHLGTNTENITVPPGDKMCHTMAVAQTSGGKTNLERLLSTELLYAKQQVIYVDPNWQDVRVFPNGERYDYRPILNRLMVPPITKAEDALLLMKDLANEVLSRQARKRHNMVTFSAIYTIIDEIPFMAKFVKELMEAIGIVVRIGRNYGVYVIGAAQDVQNNTLETDEGAIRENWLTCFFGGGDMVSARVLLDLQKGEKIDEAGLGVKGLYYVIARGIDYSKNRIRVPLADNEATYRLLGDRPSTSIYDIPLETVATPFTFKSGGNGHSGDVMEELPIISPETKRFTNNTQAFDSVQPFETKVFTSAAERKVEIARLRSLNFKQGEIILRIWNVKPGATQAYQQAQAEYKRLLEELLRGV